MAILGGAGNIAGSNPAGTGASLNYIGDHCHATSGAFVTSTTPQTMLSFSTAGTYIVGQFHFNSEIDFETVTGGYSAYQIEFNDEVVSVTKSGSASDDQQAYSQIKLLIPPFTKVVVKVDSTNNTGANTLTALFVGRVYQ